MNFVSFDFALFFLLVLAFWWASQKVPSVRPGLLLVFNIFFYAFAGLMFVPMLLGIALLNWGTGASLGKIDHAGKRKALVFFGVICNVSILGFFKYYEFLVLELAQLAGFAGMPFPLQTLLPPSLVDIAFPIGISFYIFQGISYLVDLYRNPALASQSFGRVLVYLSFFPTVLAGPIMRPWQFFPQLDAISGVAPLVEGRAKSKKNMKRARGATVPAPVCAPAYAPVYAYDSMPLAGTANRELATQEGFALIISGLFKKVVLASYLSEHVVREVFQGPEGYSSWGILLAVYGYSMQIYCDFSGYTDLALGVGRLLGFRLPQNFASPYLSCNLQDFWRRWHITLSSWLRDYLYIPLGGSRRGNRYLNLLLTMLLGGLWHGAHTRFIIWGALHGGGLIVVHALQHGMRSLRKGKNGSDAVRPKRTWIGATFSWFLTFNFVTLAWIFFGVEDMDRALAILERLVHWGQPGNGFPLMAIPAIVCTFALQLWGARLMRGFITVQRGLPVVVQGAVIVALCAFILRMGPDGVLPFIYFQF